MSHADDLGDVADSCIELLEQVRVPRLYLHVFVLYYNGAVHSCAVGFLCQYTLVGSLLPRHPCGRAVAEALFRNGVVPDQGF